MQISSREVDLVQKRASQRKSRGEAPVGSVSELAAKHGVKMEEVRRFTESAMMAEEDIARERRVQELARRVEEGSYHIEAQDLLDMAERRAIADRAKDL